MGSSPSKPQRHDPPQHQQRDSWRVRGRAAANNNHHHTAPPAMPSFFSFQQGSENAQNIRYHAEASPLLGRFRAVPRPSDHRSPRHAARSASQLGLLSAGYRGSVHVGYGALVAAGLEAAAGGDEDDIDSDSAADEYEVLEEGGATLLFWRLRRVVRRMNDLWVNPKAVSVSKLVDLWWSRWAVLVVLPAMLAIAWCAVPFPQYPFTDDDDDDDGYYYDGDDNQPGATVPGDGLFHRQPKVPGHGTARVEVNFWFFLFVYYSFYMLTALIWITKVFNLYSLNWWPKSLGFPVTVSAIAIISLAGPIPIYLVPETRWLTVHNIAWISWTFVIMAMPVTIAFCILMTNERHLGLRHSLSETQRIFTSSWWAGEPENTISRRDPRRRALLNSTAFEPSLDDFQAGSDSDGGIYRGSSMPGRLQRRWLPASFVRFVWFCLALAIGLLVYVIGEAYAEIYLRTLPHNSLETVVYVYGWISTVHLLDGLTGWILGGNEGERVGSYPLSWIFKLYFMLTYQTYVRALYARLRGEQFIMLQVLSSTGLIIVTPLLMSARFHWFLSIIGINGQSYGAYQKQCIRNVFIRFLAENASMLAFLGSVVVLHFGPNKDVYPYFAFDDIVTGSAAAGDGKSSGWVFGFMFWASSVTWACELVTSFIVAGLIHWIYGVSVVTEGKLDFAVWPELLPTSVVVTLHVLQNMLFTIIRLEFH